MGFRENVKADIGLRNLSRRSDIYDKLTDTGTLTYSSNLRAMVLLVLFHLCVFEPSDSQQGIYTRSPAILPTNTNFLHLLRSLRLIRPANQRTQRQARWYHKGHN
jgi:hypothetical protein